MESLSKFIILSSQRTGSTWLAEMLNSHGHIFCEKELFQLSLDRGRSNINFTKRAFLVYKNSTIFHWFISTIFREFFVAHYLDIFFSNAQNKCSGFKLMYDQIRKVPQVWKYICNQEIRVIHLKRRNVVRQHISWQLSLRNKKWGVYHKITQKTEAVWINCETLVADLTEIEREREIYTDLVKKNRLSFIELWYEDLCLDKENELGRIQEFLGVEKERLESPLVKQNPYPIRDMVENYDDLYATLKGTKYFEMID